MWGTEKYLYYCIGISQKADKDTDDFHECDSQEGKWETKIFVDVISECSQIEIAVASTTAQAKPK